MPSTVAPTSIWGNGMTVAIAGAAHEFRSAPAAPRTSSWSTTTRQENAMTDFGPTHPGEILVSEFLEPMGISQYRIAKAIDVSPPHQRDRARQALDHRRHGAATVACPRADRHVLRQHAGALRLKLPANTWRPHWTPSNASAEPLTSFAPMRSAKVRSRPRWGRLRSGRKTARADSSGIPPCRVRAR